MATMDEALAWVGPEEANGQDLLTPAEAWLVLEETSGQNLLSPATAWLAGE